MDHVSTFAECAACAVSAVYRRGFEWARLLIFTQTGAGFFTEK